MTSAMIAAKQGRKEQLEVLEAYLGGETVHFKSHQGQNRDFEASYDPSVYERERAPTKLNFVPQTIFLDAAANVDAETVGQMMNDKVVDPNVTNADGLTALHQACIENSLKVVSLLLQNEADVNATDNDWWTPLHAAAACDHWRVINALLAAGADATLVNADGDLPVDLAEDGKARDVLETEMKKLGLEGEALEEIKSWAKLEADFKANVEEMIKNKTHTNYCGEHQESLLHIAASNGWVETAKLLIESGVAIAPIDDNGDTPMHLAAFFEQYKMVEFLGENGAKVTALNRYKESVLLMTEDLTMIRLLKAIQSNQKQKLETSSVHRSKRSGSSVKRMSVADKQRVKSQDQQKMLETATQFAEQEAGKGDASLKAAKSEIPPIKPMSDSKRRQSNESNNAGSNTNLLDESKKKDKKADKKADKTDTAKKPMGPPAADLYAVKKGARSSDIQGTMLNDAASVVPNGADNSKSEKKESGGGCCTIL